MGTKWSCERAPAANRVPKNTLETFLPSTVELIYDWNQMDTGKLRPGGEVLLNDETLRDGLQSPSVRDPSIAEKIQILHLMEALGINSLDLGLPGAGPRAVADCEALAHEIVRHKMKIAPTAPPALTKTTSGRSPRSCSAPG